MTVTHTSETEYYFVSQNRRDVHERYQQRSYAKQTRNVTAAHGYCRSLYLRGPLSGKRGTLPTPTLIRTAA